MRCGICGIETPRGQTLCLDCEKHLYEQAQQQYWEQQYEEERQLEEMRKWEQQEYERQKEEGEW